MESVISFIMYESLLYLELWINFVSASIKGQPLYKGQKARSQCVRYSEVPLYNIIQSFGKGYRIIRRAKF